MPSDGKRPSSEVPSSTTRSTDREGVIPVTKIVNSWNDWDPLKHVIVGKADYSMIPPEEPATSEKVPVDSAMRGQWGPRPTETVEKANAQLDGYAKILEQHGITVDRPTPVQWNQQIRTPDFRTDSGMTQMPPRDILLTIGNEIVSSANAFRCRYFEYLAYWPLMNEYFENDPEFLWSQAPRPRLTDASFKHNYYDEAIALEERLERTAAKDFVTTEVEPMWDAADVLRLGKDLFIQHGLTTNRKAMEWFKRRYPDLRVHAVNFPGDPYPIHIDATFVPLRPGLIINNPHRAAARLDEQQRLGGYRVVQFLGVFGVVTPDAHHFTHREVDVGAVDILVLVAHGTTPSGAIKQRRSCRGS